MKKKSRVLLFAGILGSVSCLGGVIGIFQLLQSGPGAWDYEMGLVVALLIILPWLLMLLLGTVMGFLGFFQGKKWMAMVSAVGFFLAFLLLADWWYLSVPAMALSLVGFCVLPGKKQA